MEDKDKKERVGTADLQRAFRMLVFKKCFVFFLCVSCVNERAYQWGAIVPAS